MEIVKIILEDASVNSINSTGENRHIFALQKVADNLGIKYSTLNEIEIMKSLTKNNMVLFLNLGTVKEQQNILVALPNYLSDEQKQYLIDNQDMIAEYLIDYIYQYNSDTDKLDDIGNDYLIQNGVMPYNMTHLLYKKINSENKCK